jgi:hypothetical protein
MESFSLSADAWSSARQTISGQLEIRVARALTFLVQELQKAYDQVLTLKGGNAGNSLTHEIKRSGKILEATIGPGESAKYLAYLEFGVRGTQGLAPSRVPGGGGALYARSKAPPVRNIYQWIRQAGIATPQFAMDRAKANALRAVSKRKHPKFDQKSGAPWYSTDPAMIFAFFIAMKQKKFGRPGLRVMERTIQAQTARMQDIINQST